MSLRRSIVGSGTALLLAAGLVTAAPPAPAQPDFKPWGATRAPDQTLRPGCHRYRYHYRVSPPTNSWVTEFFLVSPNGRGLASYAIASESDPAHEDFKKFAIPLLSIDTQGNTNGAMVFDFTTPEKESHHR